jgi:N-acetylmuramoyl-L-alanine amidase
MRALAMMIGVLWAGAASAAPFRVVIDPGHGGSNPGAPGRGPGVYEKRVTLAVARALAVELRARGAEVVMTRRRDTYLTLRERVRLANAARADCFVSLHANSSGNRGRRGIETYVLARDAAEVEARRAASREQDEVQALLTELRLLDAHQASATLARAVQSRLIATTGDPDRGVRQAAYDVLAGVTAPAVLVEMGFIDHPIEGAALLEPTTQRRLAEAIAAGIMDFADTVHAPQKLVLSAAHDATRWTTH